VTGRKGIFAAMCTPFDYSGEHIDDRRYTQPIDEMIDTGLHGLVLCSGTGEYAFLRDEQKAHLIACGARHIDGRMPERQAVRMGMSELPCYSPGNDRLGDAATVRTSH